MTLQRRILSALGTAMFAVLAACGGGGGTSSQPMGTLRAALTDAPACGYDAVNVTIQKLRVHQSASASDTDSGWSEIVLAPAKRVNLLDLQNGVLAELGQTPLPAGKYTQLRLVLGANGSAAPLANSVLPTGGVERALDTPSAQQSGLKMNVDLDVGANQMIDLVLDFNACKSVVKAGNSGKYLLKPVVSVVPRFVSGAAGVVDASLANGNTMVSLQQSGSIVKATSPNSAGSFLLQPVSPGTYDLVITAPGQATLVVTDVVVASGLVTPVNSATAMFPLTPSASGAADGTITTATLPVDATVDARQTLSGGHTIDVRGAVADATTGDYGIALPAAAPMVASYVAVPGTLSFAADATLAGKYDLYAASAGVTKPPVAITVTGGGTVTTHFTFP